MSRKDYIKIAALLAAHVSDPNVPLAASSALVTGFADMLEADNPTIRDWQDRIVKQGFDRARFMAAVYGASDRQAEGVTA